MTATFAVFRPPPVIPQEESQVVLVPAGYSSVQTRPARIPPLRFQIAIDNGTPVAPGSLAPVVVMPTSYPRPCACSHTT